jgi:hypothetical protein
MERILLSKILEAGDMAQAVERLPSKCETLSSNPLLPKRNHKKLRSKSN